MKKFVIAFVLTATSAIALAQPGTGLSHPSGHRGGLEELATQLNLSDTQKQQLKDIRTADRESNKQLYADVRAKVRQFRALKKANDPGVADVKAQLASMKAQIQVARQATHEAMLGVLTADQRAQLKATN